MPESVFFRFVLEGVEWLHFSSQGQLLRGATVSETAFQSEFGSDDFGGKAVCVIPGEEVLLTEANVPSTQYRQIMQAVPYVVEEQLASDPEDCFFALGDRHRDGNLAVAILALDAMHAWVKRMSSCKLPVSAMISEVMLAKSSTPVSAVIDGDRAHVGLSKGNGITVSIKDLPMALSLIDGVDEMTLWVNREAEAGAELVVNELRTGDAELEVTVSDESPFERLCRNFNGSEINLLQGTFKVAESRTTTSMIWRSVATLFACVVILQMAVFGGQGWYLSGKAEKFEAETRAIYKSVFPNDRNVRDIRRRWNAHLGKEGAADSQFIRLFAQSSKGLTEAGLTLSNVNFNESRGDLILQVEGPRSEALVQFTQQLSGQGLDAEIGTITQEDRGVRGSIKVRAAGGRS